MVTRLFTHQFALVLALLAVLATGLMASPASELASKGSVRISFGPAGQAPSDGSLFSDGSIYAKERGFGWDQNLAPQTRKRASGCMGVALLDRAISVATLTVDLPDGDYLFEVIAFDSEFPGALAPQIDGELVASPIPFAAGQSVGMNVPVTSRDGKAEISFAGGTEGIGNSMLASVLITPASAEPAKWRWVKDATDAYRKRIAEIKADKANARERRRAAYRPLKIADQHSPRQTIDLSGRWLFQPATDIKQPDEAINTKAGDSDWHTMNVPEFWKPIEWWIYTAGAATSHNFLRKEIERCEDFTFDYKADSGWYRQWIEIPKSMKGRRLVLRFDAVASVAQVYWNGKPVASHVGMFGPFECEVTPNVRFGEKNLLTVYVSSGKMEAKPGGKSIVAVTVDVTPEMLNSLAHGCYKAGMAGIWQPVSLVVSGKSRIADVFFKPTTDSARIETTVSASPSLGRDLQSRPEPLLVRHTITDAVTGATLYLDKKGSQAISGKSVANTGKLQPKLWSPEHPNLYLLKTKLLEGGKVVDEVTTTVGFKTFEARGNRLYLNGKPYFLRGADMPPHGIEPNNKPLADKFMKMMHDGNTMATRFHVAPPSKIWLDAADKFGVGSSVGENWPWVLMGDTPIPDRKLIELWQKELVDVVRAYRNHPSVFIWTISNESYFEGDPDVPRRVEKYRIFSDLIKSVRKEDPGTPIVFHSGHVSGDDRAEMIKTNNFDDGDIDDPHFYFGWYQASPFHIDVAKHVEPRGTGKRPMISQEASTGYPDNDTGHPVENYIRTHVVPQAWVGDDALYSARPDAFLETHAQITKEYAEKIRRERTWLSGWMIFANCCWFKDVYDAERIAAYPAYWAVQKAWSPVLVSLASPNRHFTAGGKFASEVFVVNDDPDRPRLTNLTLVWHVRAQSNIEVSGRAKLPDCAYDGKSHALVEFEVPTQLPKDSVNATLVLELRSGDEVVSRNDYPLVCATVDWSRTTVAKPVIVLETDTKTSEYLKSTGLTVESKQTIDWSALGASDCVVIAPGVGKAALGQGFAAFVRGGGRAVMLSPRGQGSALEAIPDFDYGNVRTVDVSGDFADVLKGDLLDGMDPMNMQWWNAAPGELVRVCQFAYQMPDWDQMTKLAQHIQPHGYLSANVKLAGYVSWPAFEVTRGSGRVVVSSFLLADDPVARRFAGRLVAYLVHTK